MSALAAATRRSAAAMSGRRCSSSEGGRWEWRAIRRERLVGNVEGGCGLADEDGDGVFVLRALDAEVDELGARLFELRLGLGDIALGAETTLEPNLGEIECLGVCVSLWHAATGPVDQCRAVGSR